MKAETEDILNQSDEGKEALYQIKLREIAGYKDELENIDSSLVYVILKFKHAVDDEEKNYWRKTKEILMNLKNSQSA